MIRSPDRDRENELLAASTIMRSKVFKYIKLHLWLIFSPNYLLKLSISWFYLLLTNFSWDQKSKIMFFGLSISWSKCRPPEQNCQILLKLSTSWLFFRSLEKNHFWSYEIRSHDHFLRYRLIFKLIQYWFGKNIFFENGNERRIFEDNLSKVLLFF